MPFAVILDDRTDVWEDKVQEQIVNVDRWEPYQEFAKVQAAKLRWEEAPIAKETLRIGGILCALHKRMFEEIDSKLVPVLKGGRTIPIALDLMRPREAYHEALAPPPWISRLLPEVQTTAKPLSMLQPAGIPMLQNGPPTAAAPVAAAPQSTFKPAVDPRLAPPPLQQAPVDPRIPFFQQQQPLLPPKDPRLTAAGGAAGAAAIPGLQRYESDKSARTEVLEPIKKPGATNDDDLFLSRWKAAGYVGPATATTTATATVGPLVPIEKQTTATGMDLDNPLLGPGKRKRSNTDDDELKEESSLEENKAPRKKPTLHSDDLPMRQVLTQDHPVVRLSQEAQKQGKSLQYEYPTVVYGGFGTQSYVNAIVKIDGKQAAFAKGIDRAEAQRNAAQQALDSLQGSKKPTGSRKDESKLRGSAAVRPAKAKPSVGNNGHEPIEFADALKFIRDLFPPDVATGQKVFFTQNSKAGDAKTSFECLVQRSRDPKENLKGEGEGRRFFEAKSKAAASVLEQLGYTIKP